MVAVAISPHYLFGDDQHTPELRSFLRKFPDWAFVTSWVSTYHMYLYWERRAERRTPNVIAVKSLCESDPHTLFTTKPQSGLCINSLSPPPPLSFFSLHVQRFCKVIITKCSVRAILKYTTSIPPPSRLTLHTKGSSKRTRLKQTSSLKPLWRTGNISLQSSIH